MRVTRQMVDRCAAAMSDEDWLPDLWDAKKKTCPKCGQFVYDTDADGGREARRSIRSFLEAALRESDD